MMGAEPNVKPCRIHKIIELLASALTGVLS
ncbi:uncharacterized protein METZ01_LOCUS330980, partial [marine metagenome]